MRATTEAVRPLWPAVTGLGAVMLGETGGAFTVTLRDSTALCAPPRLISRAVRVSVPSGPAAKVMVFTPPEVSPLAPWGLVNAPPAMVHHDVVAAWAVMLALSPVDPAVTGLTVLMPVGVSGAATTRTVAVPLALRRPARLISTAVRVSVPTAPAVKVTVLRPPLVMPVAALVMAPPVIAQA